MDYVVATQTLRYSQSFKIVTLAHFLHQNCSPISSQTRSNIAVTTVQQLVTTTFAYLPYNVSVFRILIYTQTAGNVERVVLKNILSTFQTWFVAKLITILKHFILSYGKMVPSADINIIHINQNNARVIVRFKYTKLLRHNIFVLGCL